MYFASVHDLNRKLNGFIVSGFIKLSDLFKYLYLFYFLLSVCLDVNYMTGISVADYYCYFLKLFNIFLQSYRKLYITVFRCCTALVVADAVICQG